MSEFVTSLRTEVDQACQALEQTRRVGDDDQAHRHGARLLDLLDRAATHGIDTSGWVPPDAVALASTVAGDDS